MARAAAAAAAAVAEVRVMETVEAKVMVTAEEATAGEGAEMRVMETVMETLMEHTKMTMMIYYPASKHGFSFSQCCLLFHSDENSTFD